MHAWLAMGCLILVTIGTSARGAEFPEFKVGESDVAFNEVAPQSSDAEVKRRFRITKSIPEYDIAKEKFHIIVPQSYKHDAAGWGLFVWVDASPEPWLPQGWGKVLEEHKLLYVAARESGNTRDPVDRVRMAIDGAHNMKERFHIDPERVYVSGGSGGGRMSSMVGVACADIFTGSFPIIGVNFYKPIATGKKENEYWLPLYKPEASILARAKTRNRYVLLTGETDFNRENTKRVFREGFEAEGFKHVLYMEVPGLSHQRPSAEWFAKGINYLDEAPATPNQKGTAKKRG